MGEPAELINIDTDVIEFDITNMAIEKLKEKYSGMSIEPGNGKDYRAVKEAIADVRSRRIAVEKRRKELKADALAFGREVDSRARGITELLTPIESELKDIKQVEDDRKAAIKLEKERIEKERVEKIQGLMNDIAAYKNIPRGHTSNEIKVSIDHVENISIDQETYQEFTHNAGVEKQWALAALKEAYQEAVQFEKEEAERVAESERLEKQRKEQEAEAARLKAEQEKIEAERKAESDRIAREQAEKKAELQKEREALELEKAKIAKAKADEELKKQQEIEAKAKAERQELERLKAEKEAKEKAEKEKAERIAAKKRAKELAPDKEKLKFWAEDIQNILSPSVKDKAAKRLVDRILTALSSLATEIVDEANAL